MAEGERGRPSIEQRIGVARFKEMLKRYTPEMIAELVCDHYPDAEQKKRCTACRRAIYRAKQRIEQADRADKTYEPMEDFNAIPEIANMIEYLKGKHVKHTKSIVQMLQRMWQWIRESGKPNLVQTQRPILWDVEHIQFILIKIDELKISRYHPIQALRRLYEGMGRHDMLQHTLLRARRKDMRAIGGASRERDRFTPSELLDEVLPQCTEDEAFAIKLHVTMKSREGDREKGSLLGLKWANVDWEDRFYGEPIVTITVFEPKTGGGTKWQHCPVDLWFADLSKEMRQRYEKYLQVLEQCKAHNAPDPEPYIVPFAYQEYLAIWNRISKAIGKDIAPHDCRRSPSGWLRDLGLSDLAIGQYNATTGTASGYTGVGWENAEIFYTRYGKMNPLAIFDKSQRLRLDKFNGLIVKIIANKA